MRLLAPLAALPAACADAVPSWPGGVVVNGSRMPSGAASWAGTDLDSAVGVVISSEMLPKGNSVVEISVLGGEVGDDPAIVMQTGRVRYAQDQREGHRAGSSFPLCQARRPAVGRTSAGCQISERRDTSGQKKWRRNGGAESQRFATEARFDYARGTPIASYVWSRQSGSNALDAAGVDLNYPLLMRPDCSEPPSIWRALEESRTSAYRAICYHFPFAALSNNSGNRFANSAKCD
jgi:hypothetical protein